MSYARIVAVLFYLLLVGAILTAAPEKGKKPDWFCFKDKEGAIYFRCITTKPPDAYYPVILCYYTNKTGARKGKSEIVDFIYDQDTRKKWQKISPGDPACFQGSKDLKDIPRGN